MVPDQPLAFGALLKQHRLAAGLTQEELAERALISARAISDLERGVNRGARRDTVSRLADALQLSPGERRALELAAREAISRPSTADRPPDSGENLIRSFMIVDLRGYTPFTLQYGDEVAAVVADRFADLVESTVAAWQGRVVELRGDEALAVFLSARQALRAAVELLPLLDREMTRAAGVPLKAGIGLDAGEAIPVRGGYRGAALNLAARLCNLASRGDSASGEAFASETIVRLAGRVQGLTYLDGGEQQIKGIADPVRVFQVAPETPRPASPAEFQVPAPLSERTDMAQSPAPTAPSARRSQASSPSDTFLIADIRGWTLFMAERGQDAALRLTDRFGEIVKGVASEREGRVVILSGDDTFLVFSSPQAALHAAMELQRRFARERKSDPSLPLWVGIGLETGGAAPFRGGYIGAAVDLAARLCQLAGPDEVLVSEAMTRAVPEADGLTFVKRGTVELRGFADPVRIFAVAGADRPADGTPLSDGTGSLAGRPLPISRFLGSLPAGSLVGRRDELRHIIITATAVTEGEGRLIVLAGEPGAGKTRLAQEAMLVLRNNAFLVATGRCYEPEQSVPYYPFLDALAEVYRTAPASLTADLPRRWPHLASLLPDVVRPATPADAGGGDEQQLLIRSVTAFLQAAAGLAPVALLLDDLHWADEASLRLLLHLARHTHSSRLLLLGTYRGVEITPGHPLERGLLDLGREGLVERVAVRRMDEAGTAALVADIMGEADPPRELAELVYSRTDGNPFFVQQVLRTLVERGEVYRENGHWRRRDVADVEVPESVRGVIRQRAARLREETREVLREASVLGQMFRFDDLQRLAARREEDLEAALEEAGSAGLVREAGQDTYGFDHVLTQGALYADLSARRRRRLHLAAGEALERLPERQRQQRAAELAWHFLEGGDPARALSYSMLAGDAAAAVFAHDEAQRHYRRALELAHEIEDAPLEAEALAKLAPTRA